MMFLSLRVRWVFPVLGLWLLASSAFAAHPTELLISPRNFEVARITKYMNESMVAMSKETTQAGRNRMAVMFSTLDEINLEMELDPELKSDRSDRTKWNDYLARVPSLIQKQIEATLKRFAHVESVSPEGYRTIRIENGVEFWAALLETPDAETRAGIFAFAGDHARRFLQDYAHLLVTSLAIERRHVTQILREDAFNASEWAALDRVVASAGLRSIRIGGVGLLGSGYSFHLTQSILSEGLRLKDPRLSGPLSRVVEFLTAQGISAIADQHQGAAAYYNPLANEFAYVIPSRGDMDSFTHEVTHARFKRFQDTIDTWSKAKGYAIPYEIDGPRQSPFATFGGYMNLLNELNSWRIGSSFSKPMTDEEILATLRDGYGRQAGLEAAAQFMKIWSAERVKGRSVPALILESVRRLNGISESAMITLGEQGLQGAGPAFAAHDFMRLALARYAKGGVPQKVSALLDAYETSTSVAPEFREMAESVKRGLVTLASGNGKSVYVPQSEEMKKYGKDAEKWIDAMEDTSIPVIPYDLSSASFVIYHAHETGILDYDAAIASLQQRFGAQNFFKTKEERQVFNGVMSFPGSTVATKVRGYLLDFTFRYDFARAWDEFAKTGSYLSRKIIEERFLSSIGKAEVIQLFRWALDPKAGSLVEGSVDLLEKIFDHAGLDTLYTDRARERLNASQAKLNEKNGKPADFGIVKKRDANPAHWLFDPAIDQALANGMFDGNLATHRLSVVNLITQRTYPSELPILRRKLVFSVTADTIANGDFWIARSFLMPAKSFFTTRIDWGRVAIQAVREDKTPAVTAQEFMAEFHRLATPRVLELETWGVQRRTRLDSAQRALAEQAIAKFTLAERQELDQAVEDLWDLLSHQSPKVRIAAAYAFATNPAYFVALEDLSVAALPIAGSAERDAAVLLLSMMEPGFSKDLEAAARAASLVLTDAERTMLSSRKDLIPANVCEGALLRKRAG